MLIIWSFYTICMRMHFIVSLDCVSRLFNRSATYGILYHDALLTEPHAGDQQGRLLLLGLGRYFWLPSQQTTVGPERRRSTDFFLARRSDHTIPLLRELHWLRIQFRLCVLTYHCLHGTAPSYLPDSLRRCADTEGRRCLHSSVTDVLVVKPTNRSSTLDDRAFSVAASRAWNCLPASVRTATSLTTLRQQLKTVFYRQCFCETYSF